MSDSVWPHRRQPTRLPRPWGSPGKNTGVGCHFLLQCMKIKSESEVPQSCPTLSDPWTAAHQALRPWDFPGKSTGVECHCLLPAYLRLLIFLPAILKETVYLIFFILAMLHGLWDLSAPTKDWIRAMVVTAWNSNHWVPGNSLYLIL